MASRVTRSLIQTLKRRQYGTAAALEKSVPSALEVEKKTLPNDLRIATVHNDTDLARVGVVCNVGPRTEPPGLEGAAHLLRHFAIQKTKGPLPEEILGVIDQRGGRFKVIQTREHTLYYIECLKEFGAELGEYLKPLLTAPSFADIEMLPQKSMVAESLENLSNPLVSAFELLHRAAYRTNLGNSLFCPPHHYKFDSEAFASFFLNTMSFDKMVFVGDGVDTGDLATIGITFLPLKEHLLTPYNVDKGKLEALQGLPPANLGGRMQQLTNNVLEKVPLNMASQYLPVETTPEVGLTKPPPDYQDEVLQDLNEFYARLEKKRPESKYVADELREVRESDYSAAFVASEGGSMNTKDAVVGNVLRHLMGGNVRVKWGAGESKLAKAVSEATNGECSVSAFNASYTDSGLFGFGVAGPEDALEKGIRAALKEFGQVTKAGGITEADVDSAKNKYKAELAMEYEQGESRFQALAVQSITGSPYKFLPDLLNEVDKVSMNDVSAAAKKFVNKKPSMSAVGKVSGLPYLDQLLTS